MRPGWWFALAILVIVADQLSKLLASDLLVYARPVEIFSWLNMTLHHNEGAAFSFLSGAGGWQRWLFTGIAVSVSLVLVVWIFRLEEDQHLLGVALALILGGALGNLIDRATLGYVVDFISLHYGDNYFPTFNVADSAISVGAALLLLDGLLAGRQG
jgi:signal peptidase II